MTRIRTLDEGTVNKIAAGEVIERPASIVKELVENSLDSNADSISVYVEDGGRRRITIRDDGCGMTKEDALIAFTRHSTSKISTIDDLSILSTYGFRGEALASIASVSRVLLRTREHTADEGVELTLNGAKLERVSAIGCPPGTEVTVRDLFHNVPARRKSMKSRATELAHCRDVVVDYMLSRPGTSFSFHVDGKPALVHSPAEGMNGSLASALGNDVAMNMLAGDAEGEGVRAECYLGRLEHAKSSPHDLRICVNGRPVRSPRIASAVVRAYGSRLMKDRYPVGIVLLSVDGAMIDVNVHPSKREVRFDDEPLVLSVVEKSVSTALAQTDLSYRYDLTRFSKVFEPGTMPGHPVAPSPEQSMLEVEEQFARAESPKIVPIAQVMDTYILAESSGNLLLIDQHAASERVVYESILEAMRTGDEISQTLLTPLVVKLTISEVKTLEENRELVEKAGFHIEPFGRDSYALRTIPTVLGVAQGETALKSILDDLSQMPSARQLGQDVIWRVACHTAVRAGEVLSQGQMRQLISDLLRTESPYTCEHGRPTIVVLSPSDLEKLFKRRV